LLTNLGLGPALVGHKKRGTTDDIGSPPRAWGRSIGVQRARMAVAVLQCAEGDLAGTGHRGAPGPPWAQMRGGTLPVVGGIRVPRSSPFLPQAEHARWICARPFLVRPRVVTALAW